MVRTDGVKVLVVDDEPDMVEMIRMMLENADYEVVVGHNGSEGVDQARGVKPDLIILDLMMPEMDGFEACKQIKSDPSLAGIPVLVLTAIGQQLSHTQYARSQGLELESDDYIDKPVDPGVLLSRITELLSR